jgi:hypothetical protein
MAEIGPLKPGSRQVGFMPKRRRRIKFGKVGAPDQCLLKATPMRLRSSKRRMAKAGFFEAAAIQVASRQIEVEAIDLAKP